jgi:hypothetical protein
VLQLAGLVVQGACTKLASIRLQRVKGAMSRLEIIERKRVLGGGQELLRVLQKRIEKISHQLCIVAGYAAEPLLRCDLEIRTLLFLLGDRTALARNSFGPSTSFGQCPEAVATL